ncbi:hypothetical protein NBRC116587_34760 [Pseudoteredinibacter isoporae]
MDGMVGALLSHFLILMILIIIKFSSCGYEIYKFYKLVVAGKGVDGLHGGIAVAFPRNVGAFANKPSLSEGMRLTYLN